MLPVDACLPHTHRHTPGAASTCQSARQRKRNDRELLVTAHLNGAEEEEEEGRGGSHTAVEVKVKIAMSVRKLFEETDTKARVGKSLFTC